MPGTSDAARVPRLALSTRPPGSSTRLLKLTTWRASGPSPRRATWREINCAVSLLCSFVFVSLCMLCCLCCRLHVYAVVVAVVVVVLFLATWQDMPPPESMPAQSFGRHCLCTNATCLKQPRSFYVFSVVSRVTRICYLIRRFRRTPAVAK